MTTNEDIERLAWLVMIGRADITDDVRRTLQAKDQRLNELAEAKSLERIRRNIRRDEAEFYALIEAERGRLRSQIVKRRAMLPDEAAEAGERLVEISRTVEQVERDLAARLGTPLDTTIDRTALQKAEAFAMASLYRDVATSELDLLKKTERQLRRVAREHKSGVALRVLRLHAGQLWWSLVVATLLAGAATDVVSNSVLRLLAIPIILWACQQFVLEPYLQRRFSSLDKTDLHARIERLCLSRVAASLYLANVNYRIVPTPREQAPHPGAA